MKPMEMALKWDEMFPSEMSMAWPDSSAVGMTWQQREKHQRHTVLFQARLQMRLASATVHHGTTHPTRMLPHRAELVQLCEHAVVPPLVEVGHGLACGAVQRGEGVACRRITHKANAFTPG